MNPIQHISNRYGWFILFALLGLLASANITTMAQAAEKNTSHPKNSTTVSKHSQHATPGVKRDARGRIARDHKARQSFKNTYPCPATGKSKGPCPGYVIDHIQPLKRGGADQPSNMQWQTTEAAKQKDRIE